MKITIKSNKNVLHLLEGQTSGIENFYYTIKVDINGIDNGPNKEYTDGDKTIPDIFSFYVTPNAKVIAIDNYGQAYLDSRHTLNKKKNDNASDYERVTLEDMGNDIIINYNQLIENSFILE